MCACSYLRGQAHGCQTTNTEVREQTQVLILTLYFETADLEGSDRLCLSYLTGAGITSIHHSALLSLYMALGIQT